MQLLLSSPSRQGELSNPPGEQRLGSGHLRGKGAGGSGRLLIMDWWEKVVFPVKRAWVAVSSRVKTTPTTKSGPGILKLHEDVQTCEYQDVQVMWEMLRTEMEELSSASHHPAAAKRKRPLSGVFVWSDRQHTRHHR